MILNSRSWLSNFPSLVEQGESLQCSQNQPMGSYPKPVEFSANPQTYLCEIHFNFTLPSATGLRMNHNNYNGQSFGSHVEK
jgi:hypothetical protein